MKKNLALLGLLCLLAASLLVLSQLRYPSEKAAAGLMREASERTAEAFAVVRDQRLRSGVPIDAAEDPNGTGLIGPLYTEITTTLGSLESKRSATNPNIAAMLVEMYTALGLGPEDHVAINLSSSFPGMNIAVLCATEAMGIAYTAVFSVGASTYGANIPALTYGDMEHALREAGVLRQGSVGFSMGGTQDQGLEMPAAVREEIAARLQGYGYAYYAAEDLAQSIEGRAALFEAQGPVRAFVNVGGNDVAFGKGGGMGSARGGILTSLPVGEAGNGLVQRYLRRGTPVIHLLNLKDLLALYDLPYDPIPLPKAGEGGIYMQNRSQPWLVYGLIFANATAFIFFVCRFGRRRQRLWHE